MLVSPLWPLEMSSWARRIGIAGVMGELGGPGCQWSRGVEDWAR